MYAIIPVIIDGHEYLLIDTPGFENADFTNLNVFKEIMAGIITISSVVKIVGVLYAADTSSDRVRTASVSNLQWLRCLCGPDFFPNITIMTTKWDQWGEDAFHEKKEQLKDWTSEWASILHPPGGGPGAKLYHHGIPGGGESSHWTRAFSHKREKTERRLEALKMISKHYQDCVPVNLLVLDEVSRGIPIQETSAAKALMKVQQDWEDNDSTDSTSQNATSTSTDSEVPGGPKPKSGTSPNEDARNQERDWNSAFQAAEKWIRLLVKATIAYQRLKRGLTFPFTFWSSTHDDFFTYDTFADEFDDPPKREFFEAFYPDPSPNTQSWFESCTVM